MKLPPLVTFNGDWLKYEEELYSIYLSTIVEEKLTFHGLPVKAKYHPPFKNKGYCFWHLISEGESRQTKEEDRLPDLQRCEKIRWIAAFIKNAETDVELKCWENCRGSSIHVVIWHEKERFAVILAKRNRYFVLKSAYPVLKYREQDFRKEFAAYQSLKRLKPPSITA